MHLTERMILARSKQSDLATIKRMNLWGCDLSDISIISTMTNIEVLALSVNNLSSLEPLQSCTKLQELYIRKNNIQDMNELVYLKNLPMLSHLWLAENPCCAAANYRVRVVQMLPHLKKLDEADITAEEYQLAKQLGSVETNPSSKKATEKQQQQQQQQQQSSTQRSSSTNGGSQDRYSPQNSQRSRASSNATTTQQNHSSSVEAAMGRQSGGFGDIKITPEPLNASYRHEEIVGSPMNFSQPHSISSPSSKDQSPINDVVQSSHDVEPQNSAIPQLNVIVEIQSGLELPLNLTDNSNPTNPDDDNNVEKTDQDSNDRCQTARSSHDESWEDEEEQVITVRLRSPVSHNRNSDSKSNSRPSSADQSQSRSQSHARSNSEIMTAPHRRRNGNLLSALICLIPELDVPSLQVLGRAVQSRLYELL